jgi:hypothetical protein
MVDDVMSAEIYRCVFKVDSDHLCDGSRFFRSRSEQFVPLVEVSILWGEPIAIYNNPALCGFYSALQHKTRNPLRFVE